MWAARGPLKCFTILDISRNTVFGSRLSLLSGFHSYDIAGGKLAQVIFDYSTARTDTI